LQFSFFNRQKSGDSLLVPRKENYLTNFLTEHAIGACQYISVIHLASPRRTILKSKRKNKELKSKNVKNKAKRLKEKEKEKAH
jgi:hypothetical protein